MNNCKDINHQVLIKLWHNFVLKSTNLLILFEIKMKDHNSGCTFFFNHL